MWRLRESGTLFKTQLNALTGRASNLWLSCLPTFSFFYRTLHNAFHLFKVRWWGLIGQWTPALAVSCAQTCQWWEAATRCPFYFDKLTSPALDFNPLKRDCSMFRVCAISPCPLGSRRLLKYPLSLGLTVKVSLKHGHVVKPLVWYFCLT